MSNNEWIKKLSRQQLITFLTELVDEIDSYRVDILNVPAAIAGTLRPAETDYEDCPSPFDEIVDKWRGVKPISELQQRVYEMYPSHVDIRVAAKLLEISEQKFSEEWHDWVINQLPSTTEENISSPD